MERSSVAATASRTEFKEIQTERLLDVLPRFFVRFPIATSSTTTSASAPSASVALRGGAMGAFGWWWWLEHPSSRAEISNGARRSRAFPPHSSMNV